jgi:pimeloyl-ACP methyl ester carboxylesterase
MTWRRPLQIVATAILASYLAISAAMYLYQDRLLYNPDPARTPPTDVGLPMAEEVHLTSADGTTLIAWYTAPKPGNPTILFFHGKGGALKNRPRRYRYYVAQGFGTLFLSYRGFGGSDGSPSETGMVADAVAAYGWLLRKGTSPDQIDVVGESLGTGIAVQLASRVQVAAVALEAPYSSVAEVAAQRYWWVPVNYLIKDRFDALSRIGSVHVPLLIHHGDLDQSVPIAFGRKLFDRANAPKQFIELKGKGHFIFTAEVFERELKFFRDAMKHQ